jgi:hypothetical protein
LDNQKIENRELSKGWVRKLFIQVGDVTRIIPAVELGDKMTI